MISSGPFGFILHLSFIHIILDIFIFTRKQISPPVPIEEQEAVTHIPPRASPVVAVLTPDKPEEPSETN